MIAKFAPIWNTLLEGFGNHDPGSGRYNGKIPKWDVMHPGRAWAVKCKPRPETPAMLEAEVENALQMATVPHSPQMLIGSVKASDVT